MIRNSFIFLPRIAEKKEKNIWEQGIHTWHDFLNADDIYGISKKSKLFYDRKIQEASRALYEDPSFFTDRMPSTEMWRLYPFYRDEAIFLDIETSGTGMESFLTVIGLFDGIDTKTMIKDVNLHIPALQREMQRYKMIITFNGSSFDIPYLHKKYPGLLPDVPHVDLRHLCARIGLRGGLKMIEEELDIERDNRIVDKLYGGDPLKLWRMFKGSGDRYYLKLLVEYNEEDIINLQKIADVAVEKMTSMLLN